MRIGDGDSGYASAFAATRRGHLAEAAAIPPETAAADGVPAKSELAQSVRHPRANPRPAASPSRSSPQAAAEVQRSRSVCPRRILYTIVRRGGKTGGAKHHFSSDFSPFLHPRQLCSATRSKTIPKTSQRLMLKAKDGTSTSRPPRAPGEESRLQSALAFRS